MMLDYSVEQGLESAPGMLPSPIQICLLGSFQLLKAGKPIAVHPGGKSEKLLAYLGLRVGQCIPRDLLLQILWPNGDLALA
ncbi:MAG TPA: hypothetical protein VEZ12_11775, partial [Herpetosiphonaceae bacterium]|nr:hypothetical protein [Herpetosiphonaceae bacterium]